MADKDEQERIKHALIQEHKDQLAIMPPTAGGAYELVNGQLRSMKSEKPADAPPALVAVDIPKKS